MMPALQYLRHGKALCGKVFKRFVETFNYHNDFIANLKGDGDLQKSDGCIEIDRTDPTHPVIRLNKQKLDLEQGGSPLPGLFEPKFKTDDNGDRKVVFTYPYYMVGTRLYRCEDESVTMSPEEGIYCLVVNLQNAQAGVEKFDDFSAIQTRAANPDESIKPLFEFGEDGSPVRDFRNMPTVATQEFPA